MDERWVENAGTRIHFSDTGRRVDPTPLLVVPGASESADDYIELSQALTPRRCVAVTLRGRGKSGSPESGYDLDDHVSDVEAVARAAGLGRHAVYGFSRGVSYAVRYAVRNRTRLAGLAIGDYPARQASLPPNWADFFLASRWHGQRVSTRISAAAASGIQRESRERELWEELTTLDVPILVLRGGRESSLLKEDDVARYRRIGSRVAICELEQAGHDLHADAPSEVVAALRAFLKQLDSDFPEHGTLPGTA